MTHCTHVSDEVFRNIKAKQRLIEPRLYDAAHRAIKIGDMLLVINRATDEELLTKVVGLLRYNSFVELFHANPPSRFGAGDEHELLRAMRRFYSPKQEIDHGVVGMKLHLLRGGPKN